MSFRITRIKCPACEGHGHHMDDQWWRSCPWCDGRGKATLDSAYQFAQVLRLTKAEYGMEPMREDNPVCLILRGVERAINISKNNQLAWML